MPYFSNIAKNETKNNPIFLIKYVPYSTKLIQSIHYTLYAFFFRENNSSIGEHSIQHKKVDIYKDFKPKLTLQRCFNPIWILLLHRKLLLKQEITVLMLSNQLKFLLDILILDYNQSVS